MRRSIPRFGPGPSTAPPAFSPSIPAERPWRVQSSGVGGTAVAASGVPESYLIRTDHLVGIRLRCRESEWPDLEAWLEWMRNSGQAAPFRFFKDEPGSQLQVYLHAPSWEDGPIEPNPDTRSRGRYELDVVLRAAEEGVRFQTLWRLVNV
jgi:hypothetical protein